jgi:hypothetical protein
VKAPVNISVSAFSLMVPLLLVVPVTVVAAEAVPPLMTAPGFTVKFPVTLTAPLSSVAVFE